MSKTSKPEQCSPEAEVRESWAPRWGDVYRVAVVGAGSWGTAFARHVTLQGLETVLLCRRRDQAEIIAATGYNPDYLRQLRLPAELKVGVYPGHDLSRVDLVVMAVPSKGYAEAAGQLASRLPARIGVLSLAKGVEPGTLRRLSEVVADLWAPLHPRLAVLAGPNHAEEVSLDQPTAGVIASCDQVFAEALQQLLSSETFRLYVNTDLVGVELASAVKNIIALATGMSDGLGHGDNARAALMTRGIAEMARLGLALGAQPLTFAGLAGMGDLVATCTSRHSRNRLAGELIALGHSPADVEREMGMVAEGLTAAPAILQLARTLGVDMPITENVVAIIRGQKEVRDSVRDLMLREPRSEHH
ncbi:MAG: NAD(P)-dependent glycerol-3-phosphate dehydrogenase [Thermoleophilia bacterium]|nr:NAD(P)-dependent glycerol-3-phosphate dehydrogenase [Thermoleophilia bacterium]